MARTAVSTDAGSERIERSRRRVPGIDHTFAEACDPRRATHRAPVILRSGATAAEQMISQDVADGTPVADARAMAAFLDQTSCPAVQ